MNQKEELFNHIRGFFKDLATYAGYGLLIALVVVWIFSETPWMRILAIAVLLFLLVQFVKIKK